MASKVYFKIYRNEEGIITNMKFLRGTDNLIEYDVEVVMPAVVRICSPDETLEVFRWWWGIFGVVAPKPKILKVTDKGYKIKLPEMVIWLDKLEVLDILNFIARKFCCYFYEAGFYCDTVNRNFRNWLESTRWNWKRKEEENWEEYDTRLELYFGKFCRKIKLQNPEYIKESWKKFLKDLR
jgi:hypothetical protein